jgi:hypothetical protein
MTTLSATALRRSLRETLDLVVELNETIIITTKKGECHPFVRKRL